MVGYQEVSLRPPKELRIRELKGRDFRPLAEILQVSFPRELELMGFDEAALRSQLRLYRLVKVAQKLSGRPFVLFYVGEINGRLVSTVSLNRRRSAWYIGAVMVAPEMRRRGYGRATVAYALAQAKLHGGTKAILHVLEDNEPARRLYESLGFSSFERILTLVREPPQPAEAPLPEGYSLTLVPPLDRRARLIAHQAREPESARVYGEPEDPPWYLRPLVRFQPGINELYLIEHAGKLAGRFAFSAPLRGKGAVSLDIDILHPERGRGLEEGLLAWGLGRASELGAPRVVLEAHERNGPLISAAAALDFRELHATLGMYRPLE